MVIYGIPKEKGPVRDLEKAAGSVVGTLMRLNYIGRRTAVAMVVLAAVAFVLHFAKALAQLQGEPPEVLAGLQACFDQMEQSFFRTTFYSYNRKNVRPGVTFEQYQAAMVVAFTGGLEACAKQECKKDVRECKNVPYYEALNSKYKQSLTAK